MNTETWFTRNNGKNQINSTTVYKDLHPQIKEKINQGLPVDEIVEWIRGEAKTAHVERFGLEPTTGALNNSTGRWNEFIATSSLCEIAYVRSQSS